MRASNLEYTSFLVRLWREPLASVEPSDPDGGWLVQVEHIPSGEKAYFASLEEFFAFIREQLTGRPVGKGAGGRGEQEICTDDYASLPYCEGGQDV